MFRNALIKRLHAMSEAIEARQFNTACHQLRQFTNQVRHHPDRMRAGAAASLVASAKVYWEKLGCHGDLKVTIKKKGEHGDKGESRRDKDDKDKEDDD